jgi:hypothetical protein
VRRKRAIALAALIALPVVSFVAWSATNTMRRLNDPCVEWGVTGELERAVAPGCRSFQSTTQTKKQAVTWLILLQGGMLIAAVAGLIGAIRARPKFSVAGAAILLLVAIPAMFSIGLLLLAESALLLVVARESASV